MCDIGRFEYHWIESDDRVTRPLVRGENGVQTPAAWHDLMAKLANRLAATGRQNPDGVRFLLSAHAAHEELFLFRRLAEELIGGRAIAVTWKVTPKPQPADAKFVVPPVDAPERSSPAPG